MGEKTNIPVERKKQRITQKRLAVAIGCSENYICKIEKGGQNVSIHIAGSIAEFFNLAIEDFQEFNMKNKLKI